MYIDETKKPYPFCPGCSHHLVFDAIGRALERTGQDPARAVLVSDIGCVGMADKYFNVHTFHGLHGRSFTYASGIKLANPRLQVFVVVGDGGCGIGANHLIHAARRNIGIKVIAFNNLNFGMTGGQPSATTPFKGRTATTPGGSLERPLDLAGLVLASQGSFVARVKAYDKEMEDTIAAAFRHDGFAFVEIWEFCTAYYMPANEFKKQQMEELIASYGYKTGVLRNETPPEYGKVLEGLKCPSLGQRPVKGIEARFKHNLKKKSVSIVLAGSAGMKVISAAKNFGQAALMCGLYASQRDDYPVTVQSGHSLSDIKISGERIDYLGCDNPDAVLVVSSDGLNEAMDIIPKLHNESYVIHARGLCLPRTAAHPVEMDFCSLEKTVHATAAAAKFLKMNSFIPPDALRAVIEGIRKDKIRELNMKAFEFGIGG